MQCCAKTSGARLDVATFHHRSELVDGLGAGSRCLGSMPPAGWNEMFCMFVGFWDRELGLVAD